MNDLEPAPSGTPVAFGKYLLDAELARGGMSRVFDARLRGPGGFEKRLVVKQILPQLAQDPSFVELFVHEANTLVQMSHPNIVPVYELGIVEGVYFLAMERVRGVTVAELLREAALPAALVAELGVQVAEALRYAHERFGLVHRDVTPRNVMVDADGHVRLLDFGIAAHSARTGKGELFGSPGYMSPEQAARMALSPASDLFGLGAVLYEALTCRRALTDGVAARLGSDTHVDKELSALIDDLLSTEPSARGSAAQAASRLRTWLAREHPGGVRQELARRVEGARARPASANAGGGDGATGAQGASTTTSPSGATPRITRSIATSATLTELLAPSTTEALPRARRQGRVAVILGLGLAVAAAAGLAMAVWRDEDRAARERAATPATARTAASSIDEPARAATSPRLAPGSPAATPRSPAAASAEPGPAAGSAPSEAQAVLDINATPWAEVRIDGKALGSTPQRSLRVRAGTHVLTLECPPLGHKTRIPLRLSPGEQTQVLVDMQTDPPTVRLH